ncbi:MAG: aminotransferase class I/II-fold pyridoxal phosphate-dependent enzyme [Kiritimatiellae bacterium]|nr:aminotransferase class I/II-fold pyridoxal phosphate-dependent enzyme [Kiritimatiellia bacterium]
MTSDCKSHRDFIAPHVRDLPRSGIRDFFDIVATRADIISLGIGEPDFTTPWHIRERAIEAIEQGATRYTANLGLSELRKAVSRYLARSYPGLTYDWQHETLITVGVSEALDLAIRALLSPGDEVLYHEPCFVAYAPLIRLAHGVPVPVETRAADGFRLTRAALEARLTPRTRALLINFPCNPTGAALTAADASELADFVREHDLVMITDEVYSELTYDMPRVSVATQPGMRERTVFLNGFSKAWAMTGFRLGFACAPAELIEAMMKVHQFGMMCAPVVSQKAAIEALDNGWDDIREMRESYQARRNYLCSAFAAIGLECFVPQGAFYAFPSISGMGLNSHDFAMRFLDEERVACVPGTAFGACGEGYVRCAYATDMEQIKEAMGRLERFVKRLRGAAGKAPK